MSSIGTGYHVRCIKCSKRIKGARFALCRQCRLTPKQLEAVKYVVGIAVTKGVEAAGYDSNTFSALKKAEKKL